MCRGRCTGILQRAPRGHSQWWKERADGNLHSMNTSSPKLLTRSSEDKMVSGVAGGLAHYFGIDPVIVRVGFVVATLMTGVAGLAYLAMMFVVPSDDSVDQSPLPA
jgi:phage shock protein C